MDHFPEFPRENETPVDRLHDYVQNSDFDAIEFDILDPGRPDVLTTTADLGPHTLTVWRGPKTPKATKAGLWCTIDGDTHAINPNDGDLGLHGLPFDAEGGEAIRDAIRHLLLIGATVEPFYRSEIADARSAILNALDDIAEHALDQRDDDEHEEADREEWELALDAFTQQCRLGLFAGVSIDESPEVPGALNISAAIVDHVLHRPVKLKVFFRPAPEGQEEPVHWMAIDDLEVLAHGVEDDKRSGLLSGFPQGSRDYLLHAIDHLHSMVHAAGDVVIARSAEPYAMAEHTGMPRVEEFEDMIGGLSASAAADALAALNGVARLYTGTLPPGF